MKKSLFLIFFILIMSNHLSLAQKVHYPIAFYNVENLFDTEKDKNKADEDFTPNGKYQWTKEKYDKKINNITKVLTELGTNKNKNGAFIIGLAEVENKQVLMDLTQAIKKKTNRNYNIVHEESPDNRGIDVALIYNPEYFKVTSKKIYPYTLPGKQTPKTRDILVVSGTLANESITVLVNHWPSRRGENSSPLRERAAAICKHISDSIYKNNNNAHIIIMGDMNDDPKDISSRVVLNAKKHKNQVKKGGLYNTMWQLHDSGLGTLQYRGKWNLFDQIIVSESLLSHKPNKLKFKYAEIFNKKYLIQQSGQYKGYPSRTFSGATFLNGYSDHFPTIIYLTK